MGYNIKNTLGRLSFVLYHHYSLCQQFFMHCVKSAEVLAGNSTLLDLQKQSLAEPELAFLEYLFALNASKLQSLNLRL